MSHPTKTNPIPAYEKVFLHRLPNHHFINSLMMSFRITTYLSLLFALALPLILAIPHGAEFTSNGFPAMMPNNFMAQSGQDMLQADATDTHLKVGQGWYNFTFTNVHSYANRNFLFQSNVQTVLRLTDVFCAGDVFQVFDWGKFLFQTSAVNTTCDNYTPLPDVAWPSIGWSSGYYFLDPGCHNITIQVIDSPYTAGAANIRVDYEFALPSKTYH